MKRLVYIFTLAFFSLSVQIQAQDINKLMSDFSKMPNVVDIPIPDLSPSKIQMNENDSVFAKAFPKLSYMRVMVFDDCSEEDKAIFMDAVSKVEMGDYELLLKTKDEEDDILILSKSENEGIKELVIISNTPKDPAIIQLKGLLSKDDLPYIIDEFGSKKKK